MTTLKARKRGKDYLVPTYKVGDYLRHESGQWYRLTAQGWEMCEPPARPRAATKESR
jgi:hypothetical protein